MLQGDPIVVDPLNLARNEVLFQQILPYLGSQSPILMHKFRFRSQHRTHAPACDVQLVFWPTDPYPEPVKVSRLEFCKEISNTIVSLCGSSVLPFAFPDSKR